MTPRRTIQQGRGLTPLTPAISDDELVDRARDGDVDSFVQLYKRHFPAVVSACRRKIRCDHASAGDIAQETFLQLIVGFGTLEDPATVRRWLIVAAENRCKDYHRRAAHRRETSIDPGSLGSSIDSETAVDVSAVVVDRDSVAAILEGVGGSLATVLREFYLDDLSLAAIEDRHDWAPGTGKVLLHRARQRAKQFAENRSLRALLPFPLMRLVRKAAGRVSHAETAMAAALVAPILLAGAIVVSTFPSTTPAESANPDSASATPGTAGRADGSVMLSARSTAIPGEASALEESGVQTTADEQHRSSLVGLEPIDLPGAGRQIRWREPEDQKPRYEIGAGAGEVGGVPVTAEVVNYDDPSETDPVYEAACRAAEATPGPAYCRRG